MKAKVGIILKEKPHSMRFLLRRNDGTSRMLREGKEGGCAAVPHILLPFLLPL
jgi:hypothetical protein